MLEHFQSCPLIAIIRRRLPSDLPAVVRSLWSGGVSAVEITWPTPGCAGAVRNLRDEVDAQADASPGRRVGVGTIKSLDEAKAAINAGAQFLVTPTLDVGVIAFAADQNVPIFPGAFTPTEVLTAWESGATAIKLFPAGALGVSYLRQIRGPLREVPVVPTGGIRLEDLSSWFEAGAVAVGVGSALVAESGVDVGDGSRLTAKAQVWAEQARAAIGGEPSTADTRTA